MSQNRLRQALNVLLAVSQLAVNGSLGNSVGALSDNFQTAFIPAGLTFAVWGPIYIGLTVYAIYQVLPGQQDREIHRRVGWWAAAAALGNTLWTPLWVAQAVTVSLVVMLGMLFSLAAIFVVLRRMRGELTLADQWAVAVPFSGYFAWISIATIANVTTTLLSWGWDGAGIPDATWSVIAQVAGMGVATAMIIYSRGHAGTFAYAAVLVWAFVGVYLGNSAQSVMVGVVALAAVALVLVVTGVRFWRSPGSGGGNDTPRRAAAA